MAYLHVFMEIDTCPFDGAEMRAVDNGLLGAPLKDIPNDAVFRIVCENNCGEFIISKADVKSSENNWKASYVVTEEE